MSILTKQLNSDVTPINGENGIYRIRFYNEQNKRVNIFGTLREFAEALHEKRFPAQTTIKQEMNVNVIITALGHIRTANNRCRAHRMEPSEDMRPPGPYNVYNPPVWCFLPEGHDGPHKHHFGDMQAPTEIRGDIVMGDPLPDYCAKCHRVWPCDEVKTIIGASSS